MLDPAMLHLPSGEFVVVDLIDLRRRLPVEIQHELDTGTTSFACAAVLWSRATDSHEQRAFFRAALDAGAGFSVRRISAVQDALGWLHRHRAVVRWYDKDGFDVVRVSVHAPDDEILVVHHQVGQDLERSLLDAVAALASDLADRPAGRHLRAVPNLSEEQS